MIRSTAVAFVLLLFAGSVPAQSLDERLKKIADTKTITIAYRSDATPFSFTDNKQQVVGFSIDLCKRVVNFIERQIKVPGLQVKWLPVTVKRIAVVSGTTNERAVRTQLARREINATVLPRGDADFRLAVNTGLAHLYRSAEIVEILGRWFRQFGEPGPVLRATYLLSARYPTDGAADG